MSNVTLLPAHFTDNSRPDPNPSAWGGESDVFGHFIDPDAHRIRGLLLGDGYAIELYRDWFSHLVKLDPGKFGSGRDAINTFGAVVSYYLHTQEANALLLHKMVSTIFTSYWAATRQRYRFPPLPAIRLIPLVIPSGTGNAIPCITG